MGEGWSFNPPPYWPRPPLGWSPSPGWQPDPAWGPVPPGWQLWVRQRPGRRRPWARALAGLAAALMIGVVGVWIPRVQLADPGVEPVPDIVGVFPEPAPSSKASTPLPTPTPMTSAVPSVAPTLPGVPQFADCQLLDAVYPHGVGLPRAVDKPIRTPVTNFGRSTLLYRANARLDPDHDGIACERH